MISPLIYLGPPGTGKTQTLLNTVLTEMERGVTPDRIGFFTFTRRGVEEAVGRAAVKFNLPRKEFRYFNTLHSAAFRHMGLNTTQVFTGKKIAEFASAYNLEVQGSMSSEDGTYSSFYGDDLILFLENLARITRTPVHEILSRYDAVIPDMDRAYYVVRALRHYKQEQGLFDFTDMLEEFIKDNDPPRLEVLIIDEAQDLSQLQWEMVELLSRYVKRIYIAGDDDQTIFTWAGASEQFITMAGQTKVLDQSYRVPAAVHSLANRVISRVRNRREKEWNPRPEDGSVTNLENLEHLDSAFLDKEHGNVMLLARTVKSIRNKFVPYCRARGIPYKYFDAGGVKKAFAVGITAWDTLYHGGAVSAEDVIRIYGLLPSEGHGKVAGVKHGFKATMKRMLEGAGSEAMRLDMATLRKDYGLLAEGDWEKVFVQIEEDDVKYIKKILSNGYSLVDEPHVQISTIHRVKGGQADTVVLLSDTGKASERFASSNQDEETRVFYTGITRTYRDLVIVQPERRHFYEGLFE